MDKFVLISELGIERWLYCFECRAYTPHHVEMIAFNARVHNVSYRSYCLDCFEDCQVGETVNVGIYICTIQQWEQILEIDPHAPDFMQN